MSLLTLLSTLGPLSIMVVMLVMGELTRRLAAVLKMRAAQHWFYIAALLCFTSVLVRVSGIQLSENDFEEMSGNSLYSVLYTFPLTLGIVIGVVAAWRYWGWLIYASDDQFNFQ